jgi:polyphosphate kinase 2 (PPK2 family)
MPDEKSEDLAANGKPKRKEYERELARLHIEFVKLQQWVVHKGLKLCILFEGRDGAGKGGTIKAMTERVSPRIFRVVALPAPTEREKSQMYAQRYIPHLPAAGEIVIFDRSWYNRAGVERVMGFCTEAQANRFLQMIPGVEKAIVDSGIILLKYWLEVSPESRRDGWRRESMTDARFGSCPTWILNLIRTGMITRGRATRCSSRLTHRGRRGTSSIRITSGALGLTPSLTS